MATLTDRELAVECLQRLAPWRADERDMWLKVGMALHSVSDDLFPEWDVWSSQSEKYNARDTRTVWRSFHAGDGITLASLVKWADEDDPAGAQTKAQRRRPVRHSGNGNGRSVPSRFTPAKTFPTFDAAVEATVKILGGTFGASWTYRAADESEAFRVARFNMADGRKQFRPMHETPSGWITADPRGKLPLYDLPAVMHAEKVYVLEGEKCAELVKGLGLVATTSAHGANSPNKTDWAPLAGKDVTILPDHDANGDRYARTVFDILSKLHPPATVRIVDLPGLADGEDVEQWLERRDSQDTETIVAALEALPARQVATDLGDEVVPVLVCMADIEAKPVAWLWAGKIPLGAITLLVGLQGVGKGFWAADAVSRVSTGTPWPDGTPCPCGSSIWISAEDDPETALRPRLDVHNADVSRIHLLRAIRRVDADGKVADVLFSLQDVDALETAVQQLPDCKVIVIDPIGSFLGRRVDAHRDNEVRSVLSPVAVLASKYQLAVLVICHRRKAMAINADDLALGSRAFTGVARAVWHLSRDGQSPVRRYFLPGKMNLAPEASGLAFSIVGQPIGRVTWEREPVRMNADQALAHEADGDGGQGLREQAKEWLRDLLSGGPVPAEEVKAQGKAAGFSLATIRRAREELPIRVFKAPGNPSGPWLWRLKTGQTEDAHEDAQVPIG